MEKNIATVSYGSPIEESLSSIAAAKFDGVELLFSDVQEFDGTPTQFKARCDDLGLKIVALQPLRSFEGSPNWSQKIEEAKRAFEVMNAIGTDCTVLCSNVDPDCKFEPSLWIHQLRHLSDLAAEYGIRIGYEALSWGTFINRFEAANSIVERVAHDNFGLTLDSFHTFAIANDISRMEQIDPQKIFLVQLADSKRKGMDLLTWSRNHRSFPGSGDFDVSCFVHKLGAIGYRGPYSLEVFSKKLREQDPKVVSKNAYESLLQLENSIQLIDEGTRMVSHS
jgi:4-hydroxyphenylpyruvate dioxygenase